MWEESGHLWGDKSGEGLGLKVGCVDGGVWWGCVGNVEGKCWEIVVGGSGEW